MNEQKRGKVGRPPTGKALTSTQRNKARVERLESAGGRIIRVALTPEAVAALPALRKTHATDTAAINAALIALDTDTQL